MKYRLLGRSGLRVSQLALGTMPFGVDAAWGASPADSLDILEAYGKAGGNFLDTADRYANGATEGLVGQFIAPDRDHWVVATKYSMATVRDDPNAMGNHRKNMVTSVEASLRRLATDHIDLYVVHVWDFTTGVDEVMRGLDDLVRLGKILYVAISDTPAWVISRANMLADLRGWTPFAAVQMRYSLLDRTGERDLIPMANELDLAILPWSVLGAGVLSGKYSGQSPVGHGRAKDGAAGNPRNLEIADTVCRVAREAGCAPAHVALAWAGGQGASVVPLIGARTVDQLSENLGAVDVRLGPDHAALLDKATSIDPGFPHEMIGPEGSARELIYGDSLPHLEVHRGGLRRRCQC